MSARGRAPSNLTADSHRPRSPHKDDDDMMQAPSGDPSGPWRSRPPLSRNAVARIVQIAGLFDAITAIAPPRHGRMAQLSEFVPMAGILSARAATAVAGLLLIYLGAGLRRGKRRAWQVAVGLAGALVVLHLAKGLDADAALVSAALLAMLIAVRAQFSAGADPHSRWRALTVLLGFGAAGYGLGFLEIAIRQNRLIGHPGVVAWGREAALGLIGLTGPIQFRFRLGADMVSYTT